MITCSVKGRTISAYGDKDENDPESRRKKHQYSGFEAQWLFHSHARGKARRVIAQHLQQITEPKTGAKRV
jgi:hypothetical protein